MRETIHRFGPNGQRLFGIIAEPDSSIADKIGVIFSGPGLHYHGFYFHIAIKMARYFSANGYYTFRYDPKGVGDSDGDFSPSNFKSYFNMVEKGLFVADHIKAVEYFRNQCNLKKIYTVGLCGGGITGIMAASHSDVLSGAVSISAPVWIHSMTDSQSGGEISRLAAESEMKRYAGSIINARSLWKFITFQADYKNIYRVLKKYFNRSGDKLNVDSAHTKDGLNLFFSNAFWNLMEKNIPVFMVLAEYDAVTNEYVERFSAPKAEKLRIFENILTTTIIPKANHKYSDTQSQEQLTEEILAWLKKQN